MLSTPGLGREFMNMKLELTHEEALTRSPVTEQAYRKGRRRAIGCHYRSQRTDIAKDVELILLKDTVGAIRCGVRQPDCIGHIQGFVRAERRQVTGI